MKKRTIAFILVFAMLMCIIPSGVVSAAENSEKKQISTLLKRMI